MFIFSGRAPGALAGLACAALVALTLGGCAGAARSPAGQLVERIERPGNAQCPAGTARLCIADGAGRENAYCGCEHLRDVEAALPLFMGN